MEVKKLHHRSQAYHMLIAFMLTSQKSSTNTALRRFLKEIRSDITMKQQSYSEARAKVRVEALEDLYRSTILPMLGRCRATWNGFRVFAIDGSIIALPTEKALGDNPTIHIPITGTLEQPDFDLLKLQNFINQAIPKPPEM